MNLLNIARRRRTNKKEDHDVEMMFVQATKSVPETSGVTHTGIICFGCNGSGHSHNQCPVQDGVQMLQCYGSASSDNKMNKQNPRIWSIIRKSKQRTPLPKMNFTEDDSTEVNSPTKRST